MEPEGVQHQCFSYHHPSLANHKSRLDRIYINYTSPCLWGYSQYVSFSDHYLVGLCLQHPADVGPHPWHFLVDMLGDSDYCAQIDLILALFDWNNPLESWETIKIKIQSLSQHKTAFRQRQRLQEWQSLKNTVCQINKCIYSGENYLEMDRIQIQSSLDQMRSVLCQRTPEEELQ